MSAVFQENKYLSVILTVILIGRVIGVLWSSTRQITGKYIYFAWSYTEILGTNNLGPREVTASQSNSTISLPKQTNKQAKDNHGLSEINEN